MKVIKTSKQNSILIDDDDYEYASKFKWSESNGYAVRGTNINNQSKGYKLHREVMGVVDSLKHIDHIDGNRLNNQKANLRICNATQNQQNRVGVQANNKSGYKGVSWCRRSKKWMAQIRVNTKTKFLGYYTDPKEAAKVYNQNATKYFGEFAHLNEGVK
jgi:hypothetical protein